MKNSSLNGSFYLNNTGHRWIVYINGEKEKQTFKTVSGKDVVRTVILYEMFGNYAVALISYKGKKIKVFMDTVLPD